MLGLQSLEYAPVLVPFCVSYLGLVAMSDQEREALTLPNQIREVCDEWIAENGVGPSSDWHVLRLLPLAEKVEAALAVREDWIAERSDVEKERDELRAKLAAREDTDLLISDY